MFFNVTIRVFLIGLVLSTICLRGQNESERRVATGIRLAKQFASSRSGIDQKLLVSQVREGMVKEFPVLGKEPSVPVITEIESLRDYPKKFEEILNERHPILSELQLDLLAERRYPMYKRGEHVTVYYVRGNRVESCKGLLVNIEEGRITVGSRRIYFSAMEPVEGNDVELLKYLPEENALKRQQYKMSLRKQIEKDRDEFRLKNHRAVEDEILARDRKKNEAHGYTHYEKSWYAPARLFEVVASEALRELEDARYEALNATMKDRRQVLDSLEQMLDIRFAYDAPGILDTPILARLRDFENQQERARLALIAQRNREDEEAFLAAKEAAAEKVRREQEKKRQEALAAQAAAKAKAAEKARLAEEARKAAAEEAKLAEERRLAEAEAKAKREQKEKLLAEERRLREMKANKLTPIIVGGIVFLLVSGLGLALFLHNKRKQETDPFAKFFEGKGRLQKDFWSQATADPEHFKYVAYMFPDLEEATNALGRLSYMRVSNGGLHCSRDLSYGVYPHLDGAVCFVGGVKFSYALWREASAVLPELPHAQYFKVSTEPLVQLILPDLDKLSEDKHVNVQSLGVEEREGENGEFYRLYRYHASSQEEAEAFLENFHIHEAGIIVHVETADGILGKDENGVFTMEHDVLSQES